MQVSGHWLKAGGRGARAPLRATLRVRGRGARAGRYQHYEDELEVRVAFACFDLIVHC